MYSWARLCQKHLHGCICVCVGDDAENVVSRIGFYLHVNRTGPRRTSTHHIANPAQKKKKKRNSIFPFASLALEGSLFIYLFISKRSLLFLTSSYCFAPICINTAAVYCTTVSAANLKPNKMKNDEAQTWADPEHLSYTQRLVEASRGNFLH